MSAVYKCRACGAKVKEESRVAHIRADHPQEFKIHSNPCGTEGVLHRMFGEAIKRDP